MDNKCRFNPQEACVMVQCLANHLSAKAVAGDVLVGRNSNTSEIEKYTKVSEMIRDRLNCAIDKNLDLKKDQV